MQFALCVIILLDAVIVIAQILLDINSVKGTLDVELGQLSCVCVCVCVLWHCAVIHGIFITREAVNDLSIIIRALYITGCVSEADSCCPDDEHGASAKPGI